MQLKRNRLTQKTESAQIEPEQAEANTAQEPSDEEANPAAEEALVEIDSLPTSENEADMGGTVEVIEAEPVNEDASSFESSDADADASVDGPANSLLLLSFNHTHYRNGNLKTSPVSFFDPLESPNFNLEQPVNYAAGTLYQRLEVLNKPSDKTVLYQVCLIPFDDITVAPACSDPQSLAFNERGVYTSNQPLSSFTNFDAVDWSKGIIEAVIVLRDANGEPLGNTSFDLADEPIDLDLYFPMSVQYNAILVPEGGAFTGWPEAVTFR